MNKVKKERVERSELNSCCYFSATVIAEVSCLVASSSAAVGVSLGRRLCTGNDSSIRIKCISRVNGEFIIIKGELCKV